MRNMDEAIGYYYGLGSWRTLVARHNIEMDIKQLRYFVKVVELKNITAAAQALFIAQPSLSQHMANLESALDVKLLNRSVNGTSPTVMGDLLYQHAKNILRQLDEAQAAIRNESQTPSGRVAIGFPTSTSRIVSASLLERLHKCYPLIQLELVEASSGELAGLVASDRLALAITMNARLDKRVSIEPILQEELFVVLAPSKNRSNQLDVKTLSELPLLLPTYPNSVRVITERLFVERHLNFNVIAETSAVEILILSVERGLGVTVLPFAAFALAQQHGRVVGIPLKGKPLIRELSLSVSTTAARSPAVQIVRNVLLEVIKEEILENRWLGVELLKAN